MTQVESTFLDKLVAKIGRDQPALIPLLQAVQDHYGYLPEEALRRLCEITEITPAAIEAVSSFYRQFRRRPAGRHRIHVCHGTACHVKGAQRVTDALRNHLRIAETDDTDTEGLFTIEKVACLGCCTLAPVVQIGEATYGHMTAEQVPAMLRDFLELTARRPAAKVPPPLPAREAAEIRIGLGSCCVARGSARVHQALEAALAETHALATVRTVGCVGMCHETPLVNVVMGDGRSFLYGQVHDEDARAIVLRHFKARGLVRKFTTAAARAVDRMLSGQAALPLARYAIEQRDPQIAAFLGPQKHLASEHRGRLDPMDLDEYLQHDGVAALRRCLGEMTRQEVIEEIARSGLRGRGGAGYPTGKKWAAVRKASGERKFVVCNGDEGDPGAFMDRMLLESYPYRIIEGLAIAAYAVGASEGHLYIRHEYPLAVRRIREAIRRCRQHGLLGEKILGSDFSLHLEIMEGAGAFVCGEETALLASIEGRRGTPRLRPPYPAQSGLWGQPTLVNNVETYALVPWIIRNGADAFAAVGTDQSKGTKVFALAGKISRGGLIEVPMGATIRQIVEEIGGGVAGGKAFKAVQIGGPSGGCVPAALADTPVDFEALESVGAIMGSGGLVVLDEADCMVDIARYFLEFTQDQSCGKCTFCRIGTRRMLEILTRLCEGQGRSADLQQLEQLCRMVQASSLCGLGKTAPNPVLSTLKHFHDEYAAHIAGRCPAGVCKALITYSITDDCIGCTRCAQRCPADAIEMRPFEQHEIDTEKCIRCGSCKQACPVEAVKVE